MNRIIGTYTGSEPGALVVVFGAVHGNEPAGVLALQELFRMLEKEPTVNPGFTFRGKLIGLIGNRQAFATGSRYIDRDLNRLWTAVHIRRIQQTPSTERQAEDRELAELLELIHNEIQNNRPEALILLDLHTTSADGGIFCIPSDDKSSLRLAKELHAPVILGMLEGLEGTLLHHAAGNHFQIGGYPCYSCGAAFEAGQHDDPLSVSRSIAAVVNCLRAAGCIQPEDVDSRHESILKAFSDPLPKVTHLRHVHRIRPGDAFYMRPGYFNFQPIQKGEHLADDTTGPVLAPEDGLILMPLYQPQGSDGFFVVREIEGRK
ncbi:MAG: succinylglutamate desuccinylase/aspartoacylase family protein [Saprospirales bacterium]|nr:succinylglutamate desuccinylase/aspartoacylase family protein [Saprospirales bacterium]MBK8923317.1 succinylglutamate desuccinylase/aspartoacylase family protein [Saprospirales bacterium]